jgi:hypothetical protein
MTKYRLKVLPRTRSTVPQKDNQIHLCAQKLQSDAVL